jgi:glycerol-3-phosphate dehydrogenase (NAD(P)+)
MLWARRPELASAIERTRRNEDYLPGVELPDRLRVTAELDAAVKGAEVVVVAVPSHGFRSVLEQAVPHLGAAVALVSVAKGLEEGTTLRMSEVAAEVAPGRPVAVLSGPNLAREVVAGHPTASVVASADGALATELQRLFSGATFRVYTNPDVVGCEVAGALKNVVAIAAGVSDGLGFGDNTRAALVTRGLAELGRLGVALGGDPLTFSGLAGMGDLVATCTSAKSRNHRVGVELGRGRRLDEILSGTRMVAEGVRTAPVAVELGRRLGVELPIAEEVVAVLAGQHTVADAIPRLMQREAKPELHGLRP